MLLVPTDFTAADANAFRYAVHLASHYNWKIKLVHISPVNVVMGAGQVPIIVSQIADHTERLDLFFKKIPLTEAENQFLEQTGFEKTVVEGAPVDELLAMAAAEKARMIVVGRDPKSAFFLNFFGSVSRGLVQAATCPVLLVPPKSVFKGLKDLVFAADFDSVRAPFVREVMGLAEEFGSTVQFLHAGTDFQEEDKLKDRLAQYLFADGEPTVGWGFSLLFNDQKPEYSITDWLLENPADLVVLSTRNRNFWERLTHHSVTSGLAKELLVPMLVLHEADDPQPDFKTDKRLRAV